MTQMADNKSRHHNPEYMLWLDEQAKLDKKSSDDDPKKAKKDKEKTKSKKDDKNKDKNIFLKKGRKTRRPDI